MKSVTALARSPPADRRKPESVTVDYGTELKILVGIANLTVYNGCIYTAEAFRAPRKGLISFVPHLVPLEADSGIPTALTVLEELAKTSPFIDVWQLVAAALYVEDDCRVIAFGQCMEAGNGVKMYPYIAKDRGIRYLGMKRDNLGIDENTYALVATQQVPLR